MTDDARCVNCGASLVDTGGGQLCPTCLLQLGLARESGESSETTRLTPPAAAPADRPPAEIGPYRILDTLGEGGMGVVYLAEQVVPIRRRVALKVIKLGMDTRQVVARFEAERQALALMDHPCIARVFDAGATDEGRPYFVMEHVAGLPITDYCDRQRLSTRARLELFIAVCGAVQHAHQKGVIHRDLKPTNILVAEQDGRPVPKVIDFGVAKATHQHLTARTLFTEHGILIGTPEYMSPEQADTSGIDVDTRTDIYSLGVVLYELLVGAVPFEPAALRAAGYAEILRILREEEPTRPSTKLSGLGDTATEVAGRRQTTVTILARELTGDLDWVTLRALEKEPGRRYASASELAADLGRHLTVEPVMARPPSPTYRAKKFVRRHRLAILAGGSVALSTVVAATVSTAMYLRAEAEGETNRLELAMFAGLVSDVQNRNDDLPTFIPAARSALSRHRERLADQPAELAHHLYRYQSWLQFFRIGSTNETEPFISELVQDLTTAVLAALAQDEPTVLSYVDSYGWSGRASQDGPYHVSHENRERVLREAMRVGLLTGQDVSEYSYSLVDLLDAQGRIAADSGDHERSVVLLREAVALADELPTSRPDRRLVATEVSEEEMRAFDLTADVMRRGPPPYVLEGQSERFTDLGQDLRRADLGHGLVVLKRHAEAEPLLRVAYEILRDKLHKRWTEVGEDLASVYDALGQTERATEIRHEAAAGR